MPQILTTMIGSLPMAEPEDALKLLEQYPLGLPAWPQLPKRSFREGMIAQYSEGFPGIIIDEVNKSISVNRDGAYLDELTVFYEAVVAAESAGFAITDNYAAGLHAFVDMHAKSGKRLPMVKGQVVGPFTFGLGLNDTDLRAVWFDEQYKDVVLKGLAMKALWQAKQLSRVADKVVIFFDEPIFSALGTPAYIGIDAEAVIAGIDEVVGVMHAEGYLTGSHCCGNTEWSMLTRTTLDYIAFDAYGFGDRVALYSNDLRAFMERGGTLAWGLVPTGSSEAIKTETKESLQKRMAALEQDFIKRGIPLELLREKRVLTPSCGMGNLTIDEAKRVLQLLEEVADG